MDQSFTGIGYWFLGLTDLGEKEKEKFFFETEMIFSIEKVLIEKKIHLRLKISLKLIKAVS